MIGGDEGIRTLDLSVANAALSQLSYIPTGNPLSIADRCPGINLKKACQPQPIVLHRLSNVFFKKFAIVPIPKGRTSI